MKKNKFSYSDFSKKELECLKDYYITEKVNSMNESDLRQFANEIISHQIKQTIGEEEENEAWEEIENFFSDKFEFILEGIKKKFEETNQNFKVESKTDISHIQEQDNDQVKNEKVDMWMD